MTDFPKLAGPSVLQIPDGDNRERLTCPDCGFINYENPKIVVGAVCTWDSRLLLCRRAIDPRRGVLDDPCWVHGTERNRRGRYRREAKEACADIDIDGLIGVTPIPRISQVQLIYRATVKDGVFAAGDERKNWTCSVRTISRGTIWHFHPSNGRWIIGVKLPGRIHGRRFQPARPGRKLFIVTRRNADADQALSSAGGNTPAFPIIAGMA